MTKADFKAAAQLAARPSVAVLFAAALFCASPAGATGAYQWTDAQGRLHYDDLHVHERHVTLDILQQRRIPAEAGASAPRELRETAAGQCRAYRERSDNYRQATRLESRDPFGNVHRLSPQQARLALAESERDTARYCAANAAERIFYAEPAPVVRRIPVEQR